MYWLNVDLPTGACKLHRTGCRFCRPKKTRNKEVNKMGDHGGWFSFDTAMEAKSFYQREVNDMYWHPCKVCTPT